MQAREEFHKAGRGGPSRLFAAVALALLPWACGPSGGDASDGANDGSVAELPRDAAPRPAAGYAWVIFGADTVVAEVAASAEERSEGLMYRNEVPDGTGMLFVFQDNAVRSFWMANTYVPLDIAYLDPSFRVVDIMQMQPLVTESYVSRAPAMYGLEVRQGWFAEQGIDVGEQAEIVFGTQGR
jgi:uncharacterized membrane protein (UPF0127 family)